MEKRILLIDDDASFRRAMVPILKEDGYLVSQATTANEATIAIATGEFDLIILDGELPDSSGFEWLKDVRKKGIRTPVVFASGHFRDGNSFTQLVQNLEVCLVIHKPIALLTFGREIRRVLNDDRPSNNSSASNDPTNYLSTLTNGYVHQLPNQLSELTGLIEKARTSPGDHSSTRKASQLAHMLHGTSSSYGLGEISSALGQIEDTLESMMSHKLSTWNDKGWTVIQEALEIATESAIQASISLVTNMASSYLKDSVEMFSKTNAEISNEIPPRVLLLDDDRVFARRMEALLCAEGIISYNITDTNFIIDILESINPNVLLLNLNMPEINGLEVCRLIRSMKKWHKLPILLIAAKTNLNYRSAAFESGASDFIEMPILNTKLLASISQWLKQTSPADNLVPCA